MKINRLWTILLALVALTYAAEKQPTVKAAAQPKSTLIFFMNPHGYPCQMQDQILAQGKSDLEKLVNIRYVRTTVPTDREVFYQYGIRSLPSLIIVDAQGKELRRFAPGIQELETILGALKGQ